MKHYASNHTLAPKDNGGSIKMLTEFCLNIDQVISHKFPKYLDTQNICCNRSKIWTMWLYHRVMSPNDADGMANSVDPDQTAPLGTVWSGSALFAQAYPSENLGSLRYTLATIYARYRDLSSSSSPVILFWS